MYFAFAILKFLNDPVDGGTRTGENKSHFAAFLFLFKKFESNRIYLYFLASFYFELNKSEKSSSSNVLVQFPSIS